MKNNKTFKIVGLVTNFNTLLLTTVITILAASGFIRDFSRVTIKSLIIGALILLILLLLSYVSWKNYFVIKEGIIIDIDKDEFTYPVKVKIWNLNENPRKTIRLSSIFAISSTFNMVRKITSHFRPNYSVIIQSTEVNRPITCSFYKIENSQRLSGVLGASNSLR